MKFTSPSIGFPVQIARLCAAVAVPLLASAGVLLYANAESEQARLLQEAVSHAEDAAFLVEQDVGGLVATVDAISALPSLKWGDVPAMRSFAENVGRNSNAYVVLTTQDGQQLLNTGLPPDAPLPRLQEGHLVAVSEAARSATPTISNFYYGMALHVPLYSVRKAVQLRNGDTLVVTVARRVEHLSEMLKTKQLPEDGSWITLVDRDGVILARTIAPETVGRPLVPEALKAWREGRASSRQISPEGVPNFAAYRKVGDTGWTVAVAIPEKALLAPMWQSLFRTSALVAVALAVSVMLGMLYGRRLARAVGSLAEGARAPGRWAAVGPCPP